MDNWYELETDESLAELGTDLNTGLNPEDARLRLEKYGPNEMVDRGVKSPWRILLEQFTGIMIIILLISAVISLVLGEYIDAIAILVIVLLNAVLGYTQEYQAEKAMAALKKMSVPHVRVRRAGHLQEITAESLVPGDIVLLEAGSAIPADGRLVESVNLRVQEAVLTGESEPVEKNTAALKGSHIALGDLRNSVFMGTAVTYGRGVMAVTKTGMQTELGRIADMIQNVGQEPTPLQRRLEQLGRGMAVAALVVVAVVFGLGLLQGEDLRIMFMTAISLAVAAVPEGLPAVVTIALALGAQRMLKRNALIRKLPAVETLGSVTVICSDKTGTLTENRMTVTVMDVAGNHLDLSERVQGFSAVVSPSSEVNPALLTDCSVTLLLTGGALCNDATLEPSPVEEGGFMATGDPTEGALVIAAARAGLWKSELENGLPRTDELPFDSDRKRMTTVHCLSPENLPVHLKPLWECCLKDIPGNCIAFTKGSVDGLLELSSHVWDGDAARPITPDWSNRIQAANDRLAKNGMRVLGVAFQVRGEQPGPLEQDLTFVGLFGMIDPARPEVKEAVRVAQEAGIRPVMITGDHPLTAMYIARELGISQGDGRILTGVDLAKMSVDQLEKEVDFVPVYARVSPEHKLKIVEALQNHGNNVAMTGDGVNDAPALKKADIGVAMGITGTDVSKEAADMVLLDDNFATIVAAVEEGRRIYDNIRKFIKYALASNTGEIWVMLLAPLAGMPLPLTPLQILWINLVTDGLPGLALTVEPAESDTMKRPPHAPNENIFGRGMGIDILWIGLVLGLVSLASGYAYWRFGLESWQTILFTTVTLSQMGNALALRSEREPLYKIHLLTNKSLVGAVLLTLVLQLAVIYLPFMQTIFGTHALTLGELAVSLLLSSVVFLSIETVKWFRRRRK